MGILGLDPELKLLCSLQYFPTCLHPNLEMHTRIAYIISVSVLVMSCMWLALLSTQLNNPQILRARPISCILATYTENGLLHKIIFMLCGGLFQIAIFQNVCVLCLCIFVNAACTYTSVEPHTYGSSVPDIYTLSTCLFVSHDLFLHLRTLFWDV